MKERQLLRQEEFRCPVCARCRHWLVIWNQGREGPGTDAAQGRRDARGNREGYLHSFLPVWSGLMVGRAVLDKDAAKFSKPLSNNLGFHLSFERPEVGILCADTR